jgi:hypothetical protein
MYYRKILLIAFSVLLSACASGTITLEDENAQEVQATIKGAYIFYVLGDITCGIDSVDGVSLGSTFGAKTAQVPEGKHSVHALCFHAISALGGTMYRGSLYVTLEAGKKYTISLHPGRKCIVMVDDESNKEIAVDCSL